MIIELTEHEGCFGFEMTAENMQDAALLVRFGVDGTKEVRHISATVDQGGAFAAALVMGKAKQANNYLPRRRK